jgi:hypothetical protein
MSPERTSMFGGGADDARARSEANAGCVSADECQEAILDRIGILEELVVQLNEIVETAAAVPS